MAFRLGGITGLDLMVEAAFGYDPDDTAPVWTNITSYVRGFSTRRGRKREIDRVTAGTAMIRLDNRDRRFEGGYTGGAYGSNVVPMTPIRIRCTRNAVTYPVFYGFADEWVPSFDPQFPNDATVDLRATDAFKVLALIPQAESVWAQTILAASPTHWWRLGETSGTAAYDSSGNAVHGTYRGGATFDSRTGLVFGSDDNAIGFDGLDNSIFVNGAVFTTTAWTIEAWVKVDSDATISDFIVDSAHPGLEPSGQRRCIIFVNPASGTQPGAVAVNIYGTVADLRSLVGTQSIRDEHVHHLVVTRNGNTVVIYIDGTVEPLTTDSTSGSIAAQTDLGDTFWIGQDSTLASATYPMSGVLDEIAVFDSALSAATVLDHYEAGTAPWDDDATGTRIGRFLDAAGWPAGLRDIDTGISLCGPARTDRRASIDLLWETVEFDDGDLFVARDGDITFAQRTARYVDTTSTTPQATYSYTGSNSKSVGVTFDYSDELLRNHAVITTPGGVTFESEDATSIGRYLRRTQTQRIPHTDENHALALAQWIVQTRKDPRRRITALQVPTSRDTTTFDQTVNLELGYRITVTLDPPGTGTISEDLMVEGIDHDVTPNNWTTTLWCAPEPSPDIVIVGVSLVGGSEVVGY